MIQAPVAAGKAATGPNAMVEAPPGGEPAATTLPPVRAAAALVAGLIATFILSQFLRTAIAVIAPGFMAETGISAADLELLTGAYVRAAAAAYARTTDKAPRAR